MASEGLVISDSPSRYTFCVSPRLSSGRMCTDFEEFFRITCDLYPDPTSWGFQFPSTSLENTVKWLRQDEEKYLEVDSPLTSHTDDSNGSTSAGPSSSEEESSTEVSPLRPRKATPLEETTNTEKCRKGEDSKKCVVCSTTETTLWRYGTRCLPKCNACYLYEIHNNGESRPKRLWGKEISKRKRSAGKLKKKKKEFQ